MVTNLFYSNGATERRKLLKHEGFLLRLLRLMLLWIQCEDLPVTTPVGEFFSAALSSQGHYGIEKDLIFSFPCRLEQGVVKVVEGLELNPFSREKIKITENELVAERKDVQALGLIP